ncbi:Protein of unknown function (DUF3632) domain containing protein [Rhypophila sp. PSN 637]
MGNLQSKKLPDHRHGLNLLLTIKPFPDTKDMDVMIQDNDPEPDEFALTGDVKILYFNGQPAIDPRGRTRFSHAQALAILRDLVQGKLTLLAAVKAILDLLPDRSELKRDDERGRLARGEGQSLSTLICDTATQIPWNHSAQARLVQLVMKISISDKVGGISTPENGISGFYSLEQFSIELHESFWIADDLESSRFPYPDKAPTPENQTLNFHAFLARLSAAGFFGGAGSSWGLRTCTGAFEVLVDETPKEKAKIEPSDWDQKRKELNISIAAAWVLLAGPTLYVETVEAPNPDEGADAYWNTGKLYSGPRFGIERWRFWRDGMTKRAEAERMDPAHDGGKAGRRFAEMAVSMMDVIEKSRL